MKEDVGFTCCKTPAERGHGTEVGRLTRCSLPLLTKVLSSFCFVLRPLAVTRGSLLHGDCVCLCPRDGFGLPPTL